MMSASGNQRWIVFHADDFGMSAAVNAGILRAFREGFLTSTSLLANAPAVAEACAAWPELATQLRERAIPSAPMRQSVGDCLNEFDLGVHLNLTQGQPLTTNYPTELLNPQGQFPGIGATFNKLRQLKAPLRQSVMAELQAQIDRVLDLGIRPTHLNGHQYVEMIPEITAMIPELAARYSIPTVRVAKETHLFRTVCCQGRIASFAIGLIKRHYAKRFEKLVTRAGLRTASQFFGTSHAGIVDTATLRLFLRYAQSSKCTEIGLHPGETVIGPVSTSDPWYDPLATTRPHELARLCDAATGDMISRHNLRLGRLSELSAKS